MKPKRTRTKKTGDTASQPAAPGPDTTTLDTLWREGRAGARNFAGTTYQTRVAAFILAESAAGRLPFISIIPEGLEDIDCHQSDGAVCLVQAKEVWEGNFGVAKLAAALAHAEQKLRAGTRIVVATNAPPEERLAAAGWDVALRDALDERGIEALRSALQKQGVADPTVLLTRGHLVRITSESLLDAPYVLADRFGMAPEVGNLLHAELRSGIEDASAEQARRSYENPRRWTLSDLDSLAAKLQRTVDPARLSGAVDEGIVEHVSSTRRSGLRQGQFLRGVDATMAHVAAGLDIPRPDLLEQILSGLRNGRIVTIAGPSGSGKSAAMWRTAYELSATMRVIQIRRLVGRADLKLLVEHVELLRPSLRKPLLLCCDDLGRDVTAMWPTACQRLQEIPGVYLLGAAREEDFGGALLGLGSLVVRPALDRHSAEQIYATLAAREVDPEVAFDEAWNKSGGLMLEFVSMIVGGERLGAVVGAQARERLGEGRDLELAALRFISVAHLSGVTIDRHLLARLLGADSGGFREAMLRLADEHVVVQDSAGNWTGLHELRSSVLCRQLHSIPPPIVGDTVASLTFEDPATLAIPCLLMSVRASGLLSATELAALKQVTRTVPGDVVLSLIDAAVTLDAAATAESYVREAEATPIDHLDVPTRVFLSMGLKLVPSLAKMLPQQLIDLRERLPEPCDSARSAVWESVRGRSLLELASSCQASLGRFLEALEALGRPTPIPRRELQSLVREHEDGHLIDCVSSFQVLGDLSDEDVQELFGTTSDRVEKIATRVTSSVTYGVSTSTEGLVAAIEFVPSGEAHDEALKLCGMLRDACPEADVIEVTALWPGGKRYSHRDYEPGHKRIQRENLPRRAANPTPSRVLLEVSRRTGTRFVSEWTRAVSKASAEAGRLLAEGLVRVLNQSDSESRRARWYSAVAAFRRETAALPEPPQELPASEAFKLPVRILRDIAQALEQLAVKYLREGEQQALGRVAGQLLAVCKRLKEAETVDFPRFSGEAEPLPGSLAGGCRLLADVSLATLKAEGVKRRSRSSGASWTEIAEQFVEDVRAEHIRQERGLLESITEGEAGTLTLSRRTIRSDERYLLVDDEWVVAFEGEVDPEIVERVAELVAERDGALAGRILIVAIDGDLLLPFGIRYYASAGVSVLAEEFPVLAKDLGLRWVRGRCTHAVAAFLDECYSVSRENWVLAQRSSWSGEVLRTSLLADRLQETLGRASADCPSEVGQLLGHLHADVLAELSGELDVCFAEELLTNSSPEFTQAVLQLSLLAVSVDALEAENPLDSDHAPNAGEAES